MIVKNLLRGEERKIVSTRLYRSEFANFTKICQDENKSVNQKLREIIRREIEKNKDPTSKPFLVKISEDQARAEERDVIKRKELKFYIKGEQSNVQKRKN